VGKFSGEKFSYHGADFEGANFDFAWDGTRAMLRDIRLRHRSGQINADLSRRAERFPVESRQLARARMPSESVLPERLRPFLRQWGWQRSPNIHLSLRGTSRAPASWHGDGTLAFRTGRVSGASG
jgi:hypothetical protein